MLFRALLLQAFYGVRSERQLMERLDFDLLFRCFVGLGVDDPVWDASSFSKNRERLLASDAAAAFLAAIVAQPKVRRLISTDHFSVDGTLVEAWTSMKSFRPQAEGEDPPDGGAAPAGRPGTECRSRLPRRAALERDACLDERSGRAAVPKEPRHGRGSL